MVFFEGSVSEAIAASRSEFKPLVVLLTGFDQGSRQVQDALMEQEVEEQVAGSIVLVLEDDLESPDPASFPDARNFRAFCPVERLPSVVMVSPAGATLARLQGVVPAAELRRQLSEAYTAFRRQQQEALEAQIALVAAAAAAAAPAGGAAAAAAAGAGAAEEEGDGYDDMPALEDDPETAPGRTPPAAAAAAAAVVAAAEPAPDPADVPYRLQFKFTDGSTARADFNGASRMAEVFAAVDEARAARGARPLAYLLVQTQPRVMAGAAAEGLTLAEAGIQPRTSLQVIPHAAQGHQPPQPPPPQPQPAAELEPMAADPAAVAQAQGPAPAQQQQARAASAQQAWASSQHKASAAAPAAAASAAAAAAAPVRPPPAEVQLQVRLSNGDSLRRTFPPSARLTEVLDWVDASRTDRGAYKLTQTFPKRTFFSGDLGMTLLELGFESRTALQLELLPPVSKSKFASAPALAAQQAAQTAAPAASTPAAAAPLPHSFTLQFKLLNGEQLRGSFPPEALLQEVFHFLDTHRTDGSDPYSLVQPYPKRRFGAADLQQPLAALGLQQRQMLLLEPLGGPRPSGWSLGGLLSSAASWLNPWAYLGGRAGTPREQAIATSANDAYLHASGTSAQGAGSRASESFPAAAHGQQGARKRPLGGASGSNIRTLHDGQGEEGEAQDPDGNAYWNGNSTEFGAGPPPGQQ